MYRIGLKLWNINIDYYFDEAKRLYREGIFDYIELYIVPGHLDLIDKWKTISVPFDIHAPHFAHAMNLSKSEYQDENYKKYLEVERYADGLNAKVIVFHGGIGGDYKETAKQIDYLNDNRILIENKPMRPLKSINGELCVGYKFEELKYIIEKTHCGFCLDVGHAMCSANAQRIDPYDYVKLLTSLNPKRIHLSDIHTDSLIDEHLNYGNGNLDFAKIISILPNDASITIETNKPSKIDLNDYVKDTQYLKRVLSKNI